LVIELPKPDTAIVDGKGLALPLEFIVIFPVFENVV
jgi:hypothetical protein